MNRCSKCRRDIPDDAAFCIHCAAQLRSTPQVQPREPATGATIRLNPIETNMPVQPAQSRRVVRSRHRHHGHSHQRQNTLGPVFLLGILFLLVTKTFWPGILVLVGLPGFIRATSHGRPGRALQQLVFLGGMAMLFWSGPFWPGILLLMFVSHMVSRARYSWRP